MAILLYIKYARVILTCITTSLGTSGPNLRIVFLVPFSFCSSAAINELKSSLSTYIIQNNINH